MPVVFSANYSLGINVMKRVVAEITPILEDAFDIEIIEKHHNKKLDAPSGTAKMLLAAADGENKYEHVFGREGNRKRGKEIGVHALRCGTIAGEHTVIYAGNDEILEIKHTALSKKIFASGAIKAAAFAAGAKPGFYTMEDVLFGELTGGEDMEAREIIEFIGNAEKKTPVKVYVKEKAPVDFAGCKTFGAGDKIVFGDWSEVKDILEKNADKIEDYVVENDCRNSAIPLLDMKNVKARIEPGAFIRDKVEIGDNAVIMMGAIINIGAVIGEGTMIDMGAVLGGRATVGKNCHIGAGTVLAGVIEPPSAQPVIVEDDVVIGANAVVLEGCRIGKGAVVAAGAVVVSDVPAGVVVAGVPAKVIKDASETDAEKIEVVDLLRKL